MSVKLIMTVLFHFNSGSEGPMRHIDFAAHVSWHAWCRYSSAHVRYSICSIILQRVMGMVCISKDDQKAAHAYALHKLEQEAAAEEELHQNL